MGGARSRFGGLGRGVLSRRVALRHHGHGRECVFAPLRGVDSHGLPLLPGRSSLGLGPPGVLDRFPLFRARAGPGCGGGDGASGDRQGGPESAATHGTLDLAGFSVDGGAELRFDRAHRSTGIRLGNRRAQQRIRREGGRPPQRFAADLGGTSVVSAVGVIWVPDLGLGIPTPRAVEELAPVPQKFSPRRR